MTAPTPCHQCTAYDHGTSERPIQRCKFRRLELDSETAEAGCVSFRKRRRFESGTERFRRQEVDFKKKGWVK